LKRVHQAVTSTADHVIPLNDGGSNTHDNLELRCRNCHTEAHARNDLSMHRKVAERT
jgi:5-methylcytosine-specific restriction endonuclease McrA